MYTDTKKQKRVNYTWKTKYYSVISKESIYEQSICINVIYAKNRPVVQFPEQSHMGQYASMSAFTQLDYSKESKKKINFIKKAMC